MTSGRAIRSVKRGLPSRLIAGGSMDRRFLGSSVVLILGLFFSLTAAGRSREPVPQTLCGAGAVVGALAFRSMKRRRLGLCDDSSGRRVAEGAALVSIVALVLLQSSVLTRMYRE